MVSPAKNGPNASSNTRDIWKALLATAPFPIGYLLTQLTEVDKTAVTFLVDLAAHPVETIRVIIFTDLLKGLIGIVSPIIDGLLYVYAGSQRGYAASHGGYGLADLPMLVATLIYDTVTWVIGTYFDTLEAVASLAVPQLPGAIDGILMTAVYVSLLVLTAIAMYRLAIALVDAIPVVSGLDELLFGP